MAIHDVTNVFISYSHRDQKWFRAFESRLASLQHRGIHVRLHDRIIEAGNDWAKEIERHIEQAQVVLLLVSPDYLASEYCYDVELARILERHEAGQVRVIPVILRPCDWSTSPFGRFQALPSAGKPLSNWKHRGDAISEVVDELSRALAGFKETAPETIAIDLGTASTSAASLPKADAESNLPDIAKSGTTPVEGLELAHTSIEITINKKFAEYTLDEQEKLLAAVSELLRTDEVKIISVKKGSVRFTLQITALQAEQLLWAIKAGELAKLDVVDAAINSQIRTDEFCRRPTVFIGSSKEGLSVAEALQANLDEYCEVTVWSQGAFGLGEGNLEALVRLKNEFDFSILILTPDDLAVSRGKRSPSPRDNVLFELGLFMGSLGRERTFAMYDRTASIKLPSDLAGVSLVTYIPHTTGNLQSALGGPCFRLKQAIMRLGPRFC